jgi:anionic cell wall polymer biosynthesis LytR-Cps2A-Psr (LCP) family protein
MILQVIAGCAVIMTANHPKLKPLGITLMWLVVVSAILSAAHYFKMFWSQVNSRVQQRQKRERSIMLMKAEEKSRDVAIP